MLHSVSLLLVYSAECIKVAPGYDTAVKSSWNNVFWRIFHVSCYPLAHPTPPLEPRQIQMCRTATDEEKEYKEVKNM